LTLTPDPKPVASVVGAAASGLTWTLLGALTDIGDKLGDAGVASVTGTSAVLLGALLYYLVPDSRAEDIPTPPM